MWHAMCRGPWPVEYREEHALPLTLPHSSCPMPILQDEHLVPASPTPSLADEPIITNASPVLHGRCGYVLGHHTGLCLVAAAGGNSGLADWFMRTRRGRTPFWRSDGGMVSLVLAAARVLVETRPWPAGRSFLHSFFRLARQFPMWATM